ncbi:MAG: hypothetical protein UZ21_OP11001001075 [Microgenomates bacterium OLB22]|nr:MAG: hypothetical protein UZ21_OP11001001075 [Microgenomates bacterium OLB22]
MDKKLEHSRILTHRGLENGRENWFSESTYEAFQDQLSRSFGLEFDPNFIRDGRIVISHDGNLARVTGGVDIRPLAEVSPDEMPLLLENGRLCFFEELMDLIRRSPSKINAMHLKGGFQEPAYLQILIENIQQHASDMLDRFLIFDVKPETARLLLTTLPTLHLAPSVAHPYDIQRYNDVVKGTLISVDEALEYRDQGLYDWVWLDEWDLTDTDGGNKSLYTKEVFDRLRSVGYKIALVTPELHGTSPGLLGGEAHPDATPQERLFGRIREIIALEPDAICTDWPEQFTTD